MILWENEVVIAYLSEAHVTCNMQYMSSKDTAGNAATLCCVSSLVSVWVAPGCSWILRRSTRSLHRDTATLSPLSPHCSGTPEGLVPSLSHTQWSCKQMSPAPMRFYSDYYRVCAGICLIAAQLLWSNLPVIRSSCTLLQHGFFRHRWPRRAGKRTFTNHFWMISLLNK